MRVRTIGASLVALGACLTMAPSAVAAVQFVSQSRSVGGSASAPGGRTNSDSANSSDFAPFVRSAGAGITGNVSEPPGSSSGSANQNSWFMAASAGGTLSASASRQAGTSFSGSGSASFQTVFALDVPTAIEVVHSRSVGGTRFNVTASLTGPGGAIFTWTQRQTPPTNNWGTSPFTTTLAAGQYSLAFSASASAGPGDNLDVSSSGSVNLTVNFIPAPGAGAAVLLGLTTFRRASRPEWRRAGIGCGDSNTSRC